MGIVYSTNNDFVPDNEDAPEPETLHPSKQNLVLRYETKQRGGKPVTLVTQFVGTQADLEELGKKLKTRCGVGGSVKDGEILIQGDQRDKIRKFLTEWGYKHKGG